MSPSTRIQESTITVASRTLGLLLLDGHAVADRPLQPMFAYDAATLCSTDHAE